MQRRASASGTPSSIARLVNSRTEGSAPRSSCSSAKRLPRVAIACTCGRRNGKSCANARKKAHSSSQTRIALQKKRVASGSPGSLRNSVRGMPSLLAQSTSSTRLLQLLLGGRASRTRTVAARAARRRASVPCSASRRFRNAASSTARPRRGSVRGCQSSTASASRRALLPSTETIAAVVDIGSACTLADDGRKIARSHRKTQNIDSGDAIVIGTRRRTPHEASRFPAAVSKYHSPAWLVRMRKPPSCRRRWWPEHNNSVLSRLVLPAIDPMHHVMRLQPARVGATRVTAVPVARHQRAAQRRLHDAVLAAHVERVALVVLGNDHDACIAAQATHALDRQIAARAFDGLRAQCGLVDVHHDLVVIGRRCALRRLPAQVGPRHIDQRIGLARMKRLLVIRPGRIT